MARGAPVLKFMGERRGKAWRIKAWTLIDGTLVKSEWTPPASDAYKMAWGHPPFSLMKYRRTARFIIEVALEHLNVLGRIAISESMLDRFAVDVLTDLEQSWTMEGERVINWLAEHALG